MEARKPSRQGVNAGTMRTALKNTEPRSGHLRSLTAQVACGVLVALAAFLVLPPHGEAQSIDLVSNFGGSSSAITTVGG